MCWCSRAEDWQLLSYSLWLDWASIAIFLQIELLHLVFPACYTIIIRFKMASGTFYVILLFLCFLGGIRTVRKGENKREEEDRPWSGQLFNREPVK